MAVPGSETLDLSRAMVLAAPSLADWLVVAPVVIPIIVGAVLLMFRHETKMQAGVAIVGLAAMLISNVLLLSRILDAGPVVMTMGRWLPPFGISFTADVLGASLALTATLVALICALYSISDIGTLGRRYGFYPFLMLMMAGVSGSFLTGDIFNLYVWFEVFLISSFGLLILGSEHRQLDGATKYAILNLIGTTLFLTATALLYGVFGTLNMADIAVKAGNVREGAPLITLAVFFLLAFGMKAAAFPVNFWLPASYHTPRIVTAALFGAILTKIGVYALLRVVVMLFPLERAILSGVIAWVAAATMILGVLGALAQTDIRRALGFLVISSVGNILVGLALGSGEGLAGSIFYTFHSMIVTAALYLLAGTMKGLGGSYSLRSLSGLYAAHPMIAAFALLLMLASAGLPPASGLWPKILLVQASLDAGQGWLAFAVLLSGFLTTVALGRVFILTIWRQHEGEVLVEKTSPMFGYVTLGVLAVAVMFMGLYPQPVIDIAESAARGLLDGSLYIDAVFPGGQRP